ncbi:glycosyl hydrolase family 28-related protein, partial [Bacillus fungorum]|uniref:glycosyl hydrolase family 28-related protein n=1 Tax=Bacillus fungorum TaxID=2039284 RepID=UPI003394C291
TFRNKMNENFDILERTQNDIEQKSAQAIVDSAVAKEKAVEANSLSNSVQKQLDTLIINNGQSDAEVLQARTDEKGQTFFTVKERIDKGFQNQAEQIGVLLNSIVYVETFSRIAPEVDDTKRIQRAVDSIKDGGGLVVFDAKTYTISNSIKFYSYVNILGRGRVATKIRNTGSGYAFEPANRNGITKNATISEIRISGQPQNSGGIDATNCNMCRFDVEFGQVPNVNLLLYGTLSACYWNQIDCDFITNDTTTHAIKLDRSAPEFEPNGNKIKGRIDGTHLGNTIGIEIVHGDTNTIELSINNVAGLWVKNGGKYNRFIANRFENSDSYGGGIYHTSTANKNIMIGSTMAGGDTTKWYTDQGTGNMRLYENDPTGFKNIIDILQSTSLTVSPSNNDRDALEVAPIPGFTGDAFRVWADNTKTSKKMSIDKNGNITTSGNIVSTGAYIRFPQLASPPTPSAGVVFFDTTIKKLRVHNGTSWEIIQSS